MGNAKCKFFHDKIKDCSRSNHPKKAWTPINTLFIQWGITTNRIILSELSVNDNLAAEYEEEFSYDGNELVIKLNFDLAHVRNWLIEHKLQMHPSKSKLMFIGSSYNLNNKNAEQSLVVNNIPVSRTETQISRSSDR